MACTHICWKNIRQFPPPPAGWCRSTRVLRGRPKAAQSGSEANQALQPDLQRLMDGPDLSLMSYPNLGQVAGMLDKDADLPSSEAHAMLEAPSREFAGGVYFDGPAVFGSSVLLSLMIALAFGRILGLDQYITRVLKTWREDKRERERWEVIEARKKLERQYEEDQ